MTKFATLWFQDIGPLNDQWRAIYSFASDAYTKPSLISNDVLPDEEPFSSTYIDAGHLRLYITHEHLPNTPALWYVLVEQRGGHLPTLTLAAFDTDHFPDGTVIPASEMKATDIHPRDRVAAINWGMDDPKLLQLYVSGNHRRKRIGTKLINACDILQVARGVGGFIYGGDQVTELGKQYGDAWLGSTRRRDPEIMMPPMD